MLSSNLLSYKYLLVYKYAASLIAVVIFSVTSSCVRSFAHAKDSKLQLVFADQHVVIIL